MEFVDKTFVMAKRLKELRENYENKGLSHAKLSQKLREKYAIKISKDALIAYEAPEHHTRAGANDGMSVRYLRCLADFYGVSADYLLGLTDIKSPSADIKAICEYTGLSEDAVKTLQFINEASDLEIWKGFVYTPISFISQLFERPLGRRSWLTNMITSFCVACEYRHSKKGFSDIVNTLDSFDYSLLPKGFTVIEDRNYSDYGLYETERYFSKIIRGMAKVAENQYKTEG